MVTLPCLGHYVTTAWLTWVPDRSARLTSTGCGTGREATGDGTDCYHLVSELSIGATPFLAQQKIWPDSGRARVSNIGQRCAPVSVTPPGRRASAQLVSACDPTYGSAGWIAESSRSGSRRLRCAPPHPSHSAPCFALRHARAGAPQRISKTADHFDPSAVSGGSASRRPQAPDRPAHGARVKAASRRPSGRLRRARTPASARPGSAPARTTRIRRSPR